MNLKKSELTRKNGRLWKKIGRVSTSENLELWKKTLYLCSV